MRFKGPVKTLSYQERLLTAPSCLGLTFQIIPNDPLPITSMGSYRSENGEVMDIAGT